MQALIDSKDAEIEKICSDNYQDFISSVSTLFTVKAYTAKMKESIASLDESVAKIGGGLVEKNLELLPLLYAATILPALVCLAVIAGWRPRGRTRATVATPA